MKYICILTGCCFLLCFKTAAQTLPNLQSHKTTAAKLDTIKHYCDSLKKLEKIESIILLSRSALQITPADDWVNLSAFNYYLGFAFARTAFMDSAIFYHERALSYARKANTETGLIRSLGALLNAYHAPGTEKKRDAIAVELQQLLTTVKKDSAKTSILTSLSDYYNYLGQYEKKITYALSAVEILKKMLALHQTDTDAVGTAILRIADTYSNTAQWEKELQYAKEARGYLVHYTSGISFCYKDITEAYLGIEKPAEAKIYYDSLAAMLVPGNTNALQWKNRIALDLSFADYLLAHGDTTQSLHYMAVAERDAPKWADDYLYSQVHYEAGYVYLSTKKYNKALAELKLAEAWIKDSSPELYAWFLRAMAECYNALGQPQKSADYYAQYTPLQDTLSKQASEKSLADAEARFQNKEKQHQIEAKNIALNNAGRQKIWLISGLVLLIAVCALLFIIYRNKKRTAEILGKNNTDLNRLNTALEEANQTKARLFSIIGHDLRSPINQVYQFLKLQQLNPGKLNDAQKSELSQKIQTATGSLLETMEDLLLWSKTQMTQFTADIQQAFLRPIVMQVITLLHLNSEAKNIIIINNIPENTTMRTDPYFLQTILRNLVQNAIKASPVNSTIVIGSFDDGNNFVLTVQNSGAVFTQRQYEEILAVEETGKSLSGLGLRLVNELSVKIGAKIRFAPSPGGDTMAQVIFPHS